MKRPRALDVAAALAVACWLLKTISSQPVLTGPDKAYVGSRVTFWCSAPDAAPPVTYELLRDGEVPVSVATVGEVGEAASFILKVKAALVGSYRCRVAGAGAGGPAGVSNSIQLTAVTPPSSTRVVSEPFPPVAYEGSRFALSCDAARGSHLSYTWFFNRTPLAPGSASTSGNKLILEKVSWAHAGRYSCTAWSAVQNTRRFSSSTEVLLTVKAYASKPRVSFSISKEGGVYRGNVTCWSSEGTPPVNFSLAVGDREVGRHTATGALAAWFPVAMAPGLEVGVARCRVTNEVQDLLSEPVALAVVPVGGGATVEVDYLYGADARMVGARLRCRLGRGTFPVVSWLLNASVVPFGGPGGPGAEPPPFALADGGRTLVLTRLGAAESGLYRCRARDSYDPSGPWVESEAAPVRVTEVPMTTIETITIVFCCLLLLVLALSVGCIHKMYLQAHSLPDSHYEAFRLSSTTYRSGAAEDIPSSIVNE